MSQDPEPLVLWKHELKPKKPLVLWKHEPSPKILGLWKHELGSRTFGPLKTWAKAQKSLVLWKQESGSIVLQVSISCTHSKKKKKKIACMNYVWTWSPHQEVHRQSPLRFGPHFDPLHDYMHFYLHAFLSTCIIHSPWLNTDSKVRCLFHTLTFAFQALPIRGILLTPYFATCI